MPYYIPQNGTPTSPQAAEFQKNFLNPSVFLQVGFRNNNFVEINVFRYAGDSDTFAQATIRIYFVGASQISPLVMLSNVWFNAAQSRKTFVTELSFTATDSTIVTLPANPYEGGGWFYAVQVNDQGVEVFASAPVPTSSIDPGDQIPVNEVTDVAVTMQNIDGIIKLTFEWRLPNPLETLLNGNVQPWIYNYRNEGNWREGPTFQVRAATLQTETGTMKLYPDYDGSHDVEVWFVSSNPARLYDNQFINIPAPMVTLVGGIGP